MKRALTPPRPSSTSQNIEEATRQARLRSPFSSRSLNTGTKADESAASATSARIVFGTRNAMLNAFTGPLTPK